MASSGSSVTATTVNGTSRISGLSSGIDVDSIVAQLMTANKTKLNKLKQKEQLAEWKQTAYRDIISDIQTFSNKYFNVSSASNIMSKKNFQSFAVTSSSAAVSASYTSDAVAGSHTVTVSQLATAAAKTTNGRLSRDITGTAAADYASAAGNSFVISVDGTNYTVTLSADAATADDLQTAIDTAVGEGKVIITEDASGLVTIAAADASGVQKLSLSSPASGTSALDSLGLTAGQANRISISSTLETLGGSLATGLTFDEDDQVALVINGVNFTFDKETTLAEMMSEINSSAAGVTMKYDELADKLVLTAAATGAGNTLNVSETGSTFLTAALGAATVAGTDARLTVDGVSLTRSSNTVTVAGVTYTLNQVTTASAAATVTLTQDADTVYNNISSFIDDYNGLIATINNKLSEEYDADYPPLTDDEKADMSDDEIEKWEVKAKTGLLARDSTLRTFLTNMRTALQKSVSGLNLSRVGITTGTYDEQGKLYINEDTLKTAIQNDAESVMNLFTQQSTSYPGTASVRKLSAGARAIRSSEEGIAYRIYDILQDNISTLTDSSGNKGALLLKAGVEHDTTESNNTLSNQITALKKKIDKEEDRLDDLSERLYAQYTRLETYINQMNTQLSALSSYLSE